MAVQTVETESALERFTKSIGAAIGGVVLFFLSFIVLIMTEGATDWSKIAKDAVEVGADEAGQHDGKFIAATGELTTSEMLGDPGYLQPGAYLSLNRFAEVYAWKEVKKTKKKGDKKITTYTMEQEWTSNPDSSSDWQPENKRLYSASSLPIDKASYQVTGGAVGQWTFSADSNVDLPNPSNIDIDSSMLDPNLTNAQISDGEIYLNGADPSSPLTGDVRISYTAAPITGQYTFMGTAAGNTINAFESPEGPFHRIFEGTKAQAIETLSGEHTMVLWLGRIGGFLMMWIGMNLAIGPLHFLTSFIPMLETAGRAVAGAITFVIALALTVVTSVIGMILNSWVAIVLVLGGLGGLFFYKRSQAKKAEAPATSQAA